MQLSKYLTLQDAEKSNVAKRLGINNSLPLEYLENAKKIASLYDDVYEHFNSNVRITSFYRSKKLNTVIGGSPTSSHCFGEAIDIEGINGVKNSDILAYCRTLPLFDQIINEYPEGIEPNWVHVSVRVNKSNRKQVLRVDKINKKSIYSLI